MSVPNYSKTRSRSACSVATVTYFQRHHEHPIDCSRMVRLNSLALAITQWYRAAIMVRNRAKMVVRKTLAHMFVYPRERIEAVLACSHTRETPDLKVKVITLLPASKPSDTAVLNPVKAASASRLATLRGAQSSPIKCKRSSPAFAKFTGPFPGKADMTAPP